MRGLLRGMAVLAAWLSRIDRPVVGGVHAARHAGIPRR